MSDRRNDRTLFESALSSVAADARRDVLDGLYCDLHNKGHSLVGNTGETDLGWFAERLHDRWRNGVGPSWGQLGQRGRDDWRRIAEAAVGTLPLLMSRVGNRCVLHAQALGTVMDEERRRRREPPGEREVTA